MTDTSLVEKLEASALWLESNAGRIWGLGKGNLNGLVTDLREAATALIERDKEKAIIGDGAANTINGMAQTIATLRSRVAELEAALQAVEARSVTPGILEIVRKPFSPKAKKETSK